MNQAWIGLAAVLAAGCGGGLDNGGNPPNVFSLQGKVGGTSVPQQAKVFAIWHVLSVQADPQSPLGHDLNWSYDYKFGEGSSSAFDFSSSFAAAPPTDALSPFGFGTATLVLRASDALIADGKLAGMIGDANGDSASYRVVYRGDGFVSEDPQEDAFPPGFSCGVCKADQSGFSATFTPVDCATVALTTPSDGFGGDCWLTAY